MKGEAEGRLWRVRPEAPFLVFICLVAAGYMGLLILLVGANVLTVSWGQAMAILQEPDIQHSIVLTFVTCTATAILSVLFSVPLGYVLSRFYFRGKALVDTLMDIPILLPPLVVGLSLLILFNRLSPSSVCWILAGASFVAFLMALWNGRGVVMKTFAVLTVLFSVGAFLLGGGSLEKGMSRIGFPMTFHPLGIILAQFPVAAAFAVRTMRTTFDQISPRFDEVAQTLGCHRGQAFFRVVLPQAGKGMLAAGTMAWARALGEFGPVLIFAGATRGRTEVLATSVFLEINIGNLPGAAALSLLMIMLAVATLLLVRFFAEKGGMRS